MNIIFLLLFFFLELNGQLTKAEIKQINNYIKIVDLQLEFKVKYITVEHQINEKGWFFIDFNKADSTMVKIESEMLSERGKEINYFYFNDTNLVLIHNINILFNKDFGNSKKINKPDTITKTIYIANQNYKFVKNGVNSKIDNEIKVFYFESIAFIKNALSVNKQILADFIVKIPKNFIDK